MLNGKLNMVAPCLFGVEGILADELRRFGIENVRAENGRVLFSGDLNTLAFVNINTRYAERVLINVGQFYATDFTALFEGVKNLPWEDFIGKEDAFPVNGWSLNSQLFSIPDCQSIVKKAIVERLKTKYNISWFNETGTEYKVRFSIMKNEVTLMIDTSGEPLFKRGYREKAAQAPLRETLAAALVKLSRPRENVITWDPFCGSGTIAIEAALIMTNITELTINVLMKL